MSGMFYPNTTMSIYRTVAAEDGFGIEQDSNSTPLASAIPAAVSELSWQSITSTDQTKYSPGSYRGTLVDEFIIRFRPQTDVREGDRLYDERNTVWYQARNVTRQYPTLGYSDVRVGAIRIGSYSTPVNG